MTDMLIRNTEDLIRRLEDGERLKYVFFWGHRRSARGVSKSCFSQWYDAPFVSGGAQYATAEHYMMAEKARLFGDTTKIKDILTAEEAGKAKAIGRTVANFDAEVWDQKKFEIVVRGNYEKFSQKPALREFICNSGARVLV
ncbi:MAG: NADAR family protein, partial [Pseudomonadota bacterium]